MTRKREARTHNTSIATSGADIGNSAVVQQQFQPTNKTKLKLLSSFFKNNIEQ